MSRTFRVIIATVLATVALIRPAFCGELHAAIVKADLVKVKALLKANPDLVFSTDKDGWTPLLVASLFGYTQAVEVLLSCKAQVNVRDAHGYTPLHWAAVGGCKDMVVLLLTNKAEVNARNDRGDTPLLVAAAGGKGDVAALLIANKADVNTRDNQGKTPLHYAASRADKKLTELLLAHKANVNARDNNGETPLRSATRGRSPGYVEELFKEIQAATNSHQGRNPPLIIHNSQDEIAKLLLRRGGQR